ncbi:MAG: ABC transporter permease subunit [Dehalococcoidia bacterium]|nr:ABC transporter permease subunit [Dehalococcoidia bacterium]
MYDDFTLPGSIVNTLSTVQTFGLMLLAILTASVVGIEYGLGTLRTALVRGTGRISYVAGKFLMLSVVAAGALMIGAGVAALSSVVAGSLVASPSGYAGSSTSWADASIAFGKTWSSLLPYMALTGFVTVFARSSAIGMAVGLSYLFAEQIIVGLLSGLFNWFQDVADFLLVRNIMAWAGGSSFGMPAMGGPPLLQTFLILAIYTLLLMGSAFWLIRKRDVAGASGG